MKNIKICVVGLGYVGLPLAIEFGKKFETIGYDNSLSRIRALKINKDDFHYISKHHNDKSLDGLTLSIMVRYRQSFQEGSLHVKEDGYYVLFKEKQRGITPGQFAAFYINDELIASGVIHY